MSAPRISFEFFPPQSLEASFRLWETVRALRGFAPEFVSVTYGAGGTTRQLTHEAVTTIARHYGLNVAAHLTCVEATRAETMAIVDAYAEAGVKELVALRGDAPKGAQQFVPHPEGFADAAELVAALAATGKFRLRVGAYPERHPDAPDDMADVRWLKRKFDAGADSAITQFFFEADTFFRFRDACAKEGIAGPVIPGILPIQSWEGAKRFAARCGAQVSAALDARFAGVKDKDSEQALAIELATGLCQTLIAGGVEALHFYTLNRPDLTGAVCRGLGLEPAALEEVA